LGNLDEALEWMERAYDDRRGWVVYANVNALFDPLREKPRFKALVEKMRL
jgi:hypothetical protein